MNTIARGPAPARCDWCELPLTDGETDPTRDARGLPTTAARSPLLASWCRGCVLIFTDGQLPPGVTVLEHLTAVGAAARRERGTDATDDATGQPVCSWIATSTTPTGPDFSRCDAAPSVEVAGRWYCDAHGRTMYAYQRMRRAGKPPYTRLERDVT